MGIDIGSITTKLVMLDEKQVFYRNTSIISDRAEIVAEKSLDQALTDTFLKRDDIDFIVATGSELENNSFVDLQKNTCLCLFTGGMELFPRTRTIVEVGAENTTVIGLNKAGQIRDFAENDKCAAGGGVFLEAMAKALGLSLEEMAEEAMSVEKGVDICSTCTIFAEQEVLSYSFEAHPPPRAEIMAGLHESLASRVAGLAIKVRVVSPLLLCGGVAKNRAFVRSFRTKVKAELYLPETPQFVAALGAAIYGRKQILDKGSEGK